MIGEVDLQKVQALVNGRDETGPPSQSMDGADATDGHAARAVTNFIMDVAGGHNRLVTAVQVRFIQTALHTALAVSQSLVYDSFHSKSLRCLWCKTKPIFN